MHQRKNFELGRAMRGGKETVKAEGTGKWVEGARDAEESYEAVRPWVSGIGMTWVNLPCTR
jgi:hypothetical protein